MAEQEVSPYSTFKIISTLIGLHNDIIKDETSTMNYDGTQYPNPEWNENLTLQKAFQTSCIWYFHQIINNVGEQEVKKELSELEIMVIVMFSAWEGSMINPYKRIEWVLARFIFENISIRTGRGFIKNFEGKSFYDSQNVEILKKIMLIEDEQEKKVYGKTGSGTNGEAWFIGFTEKGQQREYFAVYLEDSLQKERVSSTFAKEIALK